jgi:hypothetical protein
MSALEVNRIKVRLDAIESTLANWDATMKRIEGMFVDMKSSHESMMQEKADDIRRSVLAEIRANADVTKREMLQQLAAARKP